MRTKKHHKTIQAENEKLIAENAYPKAHYEAAMGNWKTGLDERDGLLAQLAALNVYVERLFVRVEELLGEVYDAGLERAETAGVIERLRNHLQFLGAKEVPGEEGGFDLEVNMPKFHAVHRGRLLAEWAAITGALNIYIDRLNDLASKEVSRLRAALDKAEAVWKNLGGHLVGCNCDLCGAARKVE